MTLAPRSATCSRSPQGSAARPLAGFIVACGLLAGAARAAGPGEPDHPAQPSRATSQPGPEASSMFPSVEKLPSHPELPDALTMLDGTPVKTRKDWYEKRRPELKNLFQHYEYGYLETPDSRLAQPMECRVTKTDDSLLGGKARLKEVEISLGKIATIHLAIFLPKKATAPVPVFLALNPCGNFAVVKDPAVTQDKSAYVQKGRDQGRGSEADFWCVENTIDRGYAFATFHQSDVEPDRNDKPTGIRSKDQQYQKAYLPEDRWGTLAAWASGLIRAVDYLRTDASIDRDRIAVIGHSRRGKAALLAAAFDERIWLVVPHQSGTGGCALSRDNDQETVNRITTHFPQWFNARFARFAGQEDRLPVDQHLLMALVAPRALMDTGGLKDAWSNYPSALKALREADKVYKFLGAKGIVGSGVVSGDEKITAANCGNLVQYRRDTNHTLNQDYWNAILDFADLQRAAATPRTESGPVPRPR